jgi:hypothetical protein
LFPFRNLICPPGMLCDINQYFSINVNATTSVS